MGLEAKSADIGHLFSVFYHYCPPYFMLAFFFLLASLYLISFIPKDKTIRSKSSDSKQSRVVLLSFKSLFQKESRIETSTQDITHACTPSLTPPPVVRGSPRQCRNLEGDVYSVGVSDDEKDGGRQRGRVHSLPPCPPDV